VTTSRRSSAAFSLVEVMVVIVIVSIVAALAVPQLLPEVHKAHVNGAAEVLASTLARARSEAMVGKRCVRVWIDSTNTRRIVVERLNTFDCDTSPATFPAGFNNVGLDGVNRTWSPVSSVSLDNKNLVVTLTHPPSDTGACSTANGGVNNTPAGFACQTVIFRPNGRVWTLNPDQDDDALFTIAHPELADVKRVLVNANGLICTYRLGQAALAGTGANDFVCPP
jgi:prepilin-type N-terminal cleavage/methylation domain-containing protein